MDMCTGINVYHTVYVTFIRGCRIRGIIVGAIVRTVDI